MKTSIAVAVLLVAAPAAVQAANSAAGQATFRKSCKICHGAEGQGNAAIGKALGVTIPDLGSKAVQAKSDDELKTVILQGKGKMRPVKTVGAGDIPDIIAFLRTLAKH